MMLDAVVGRSVTFLDCLCQIRMNEVSDCMTAIVTSMWGSACDLLHDKAMSDLIEENFCYQSWLYYLIIAPALMEDEINLCNSDFQPFCDYYALYQL